MVSAVGSLLEKADAVYNQLNAHKPQLETLLLQVRIPSRFLTFINIFDTESVFRCRRFILNQV